MKIRMSQLQALDSAFGQLQSQRVKGMARFVYELSLFLKKESEYFNIEKEKLLKEYGEKDEKGNLIKDENGNVKILSKDGQKALIDFLNEETSDSPEMTKEQGELLDTEYALTFNEYAILVQLVRKDE
jgi:hypothetical protein